MNPSDQTHTEYSEEWLSAYIDDELSDAQRAIVEQRVAGDSHAQRLLNELQHMRGLIGQLPSWSGGLIDHEAATEGKPQSELSLHSESFAETLEQACRSHDEDSQAGLGSQADRVHAAGDVARRDVSWWRPVALAACLALLAGGGIWWWQSESATTLATAARITEPQENRARDDVSAVPQLRAAPEASGVETLKLEASGVETPLEMASRGAVGSANGMGGGMGGGMMESAAGALDAARATAPAGASMAESSSEAVVANSPSAARLQFPLPTEESAPYFAQPPPALRSADRSAEGDSDLLRGAVEERGLAKSSVADLEPDTQNEAQQSRIAASARSPADQVQLAHSAGWSSAEVTRALQRLAPMLNVPLAPSSGQDDTGQDGLGRAADIPIALIAQRPAAEQATPLMDVLSQQSVALQQVAPSEAKSFLGATLPKQASATRDKAAADMSPPADARQVAPTVALFVLREEAEQILQAARQSGEMLSNPVWITSASGSTTPAGPKQQVVLLFTPQ